MNNLSLIIVYHFPKMYKIKLDWWEPKINDSFVTSIVVKISVKEIQHKSTIFKNSTSKQAMKMF